MEGRLFEGVAEEAEKRESEEAEAGEGLKAGDGAQPAAGLEVVLAKEEETDPAPEVEPAEAEIDDAHQAEKDDGLEESGFPAQAGPEGCGKPAQAKREAVQAQRGQEFPEPGLPRWGRDGVRDGICGRGRDGSWDGSRHAPGRAGERGSERGFHLRASLLFDDQELGSEESVPEADPIDGYGEKRQQQGEDQGTKGSGAIVAGPVVEDHGQGGLGVALVGEIDLEFGFGVAGLLQGIAQVEQRILSLRRRRAFFGLLGRRTCRLGASACIGCRLA